MNYLIAVLAALLVLPMSVLAEQDDDKPITSIIEIRGGKIAKEKHEIEIYDYHSGTYNTVDVYREPKAEPKAQAGSVNTPASNQQMPR